MYAAISIDFITYFPCGGKKWNPALEKPRLSGESPQLVTS